jgi:hypothetical protein
VFHLQVQDNPPHTATPAPENAAVGDFPGNLLQPPNRHRYGPVEGAAVGVVTLVVCLTPAGATPAPPTQRLKRGAGQFRDAALDTAR